MISTSPFTVIEGGGQTSVLIPSLVKDAETGKVCMQCRIGDYTATLPLPEHLAGADEARLQAFFDAVVPEMTEKLQTMARKERRKSRRKARNA